MMHFTKLPKLSKGDQVAIVSPSAGLPAIFPWVQDLGLKRLRNIFALNPKEYPSTRIMGAPLEDRARDVMAAFADSENKAVFTSIGGEDQIKLIKHLDPQVFLDNPKPFFGYSDNTHLHNFLWSLHIPSYYGGAIMTQLAFQAQMNDITISSLNHALFDEGEYELEISDQYNDEGLDWSIKDNLTKNRKMEPSGGLIWDGDIDAKGILWGGCVESLIVQSAAGKYLPSNDDLENTILFIETAEDIPDHWIVEYLLTGFGERDWFDIFQAVLVGRPKAWEFDKQNSAEVKAEYCKLQREVIVKTVRQYNKTIPIIQNIDFGHTDPQVVLPNGNMARVINQSKKILLSY
jgi:muramoyltetrapeptide carboxypeptidase LdcA involved in peptidoglycan recycling